MTRTHISIIGIALMLLFIGAGAAACNENNQYIVPEGRYLTIDSFGNVMLAFYPPDALAPYGRFADGNPIPDGYLNPSPPHVGGVTIPGWMQEARSQMPQRPHQTPSRFRSYVRGR